MRYCINPNCPSSKAQSDVDEQSCTSCGSDLLLRGRYRLIQQLGKGSFGRIFAVEDLRGTTPEENIQKVLKVLLTSHPQAVSLFQREARVLTQLQCSGIPKVEIDGYFSFCTQDSEEPVHCLVMEKIEGINLRDWLSSRNNQPIHSEQAISWLKQLAEILAQIQAQQYLHRDIKPSNIMLRPDGKLVLIDFGAVREATETYLQGLTGRGGTVVIAPGYTPPEQANGRAVPQSDFYALGRTFVHLLTGKHPLDLSESPTGQLNWRDSAPQVSPKLADLIDQMMAASPAHRPKDVQEILYSLNAIDHPPKKRWFMKGLVVGTVLLSMTTIIHQLIEASKTCPIKFGDHLSCGEEILFSTPPVAEKQKAAQAFARQDYPNATRWLEAARSKQPTDPETLIYLNNAQLANRPTYTIAVVAPSSCNTFAAQEILRGVAQAQNEVNYGAKINGIGLRVVVADDANTPAQGQKVAEALSSQSEILGVIGHCASVVTRSAIKVYAQHQLAIISPTSTSEELSLQGEVNPFIFRIAPSNRVAAGAMASYLFNQAEQQKVAIFYSPQSSYSKSLRDQFRVSFTSSGGKVVNEFDLSNSSFNAGNAIEQAHNRGATALVLLPEGHTHPQVFNNALEVVEDNRRRYLMIGGDNLYSPKVLKTVGQSTVDRLIVTVPWQELNSPNPKFPQAANDLWGAGISWRTALAYDATRVLITALQEHSRSNRSLVQKALKDPTFKATGATGVIRFQSNGDQNEPLIQLVKVVKSSCHDSYEFVPVELSPSQTNNSSKCKN